MWKLDVTRRGSPPELLVVQFHMYQPTVEGKKTVVRWEWCFSPTHPDDEKEILEITTILEGVVAGLNKNASIMAGEEANTRLIARANKKKATQNDTGAET